MKQLNNVVKNIHKHFYNARAEYTFLIGLLFICSFIYNVFGFQMLTLSIGLLLVAFSFVLGYD